MSQPRRRDLQPLQTNDRATILVGIGAWAIALVVLLIVQPAPADRWWIWTCVSGIGGGLFGLWYVHRRDRRAARPPERTSAESTTTASPLSDRT
ncbi:DUF2530 domain-containing protein [Thermostaphylospora chromogena]|uniref:DUF2530 domain-containing protein n=1 Tax=Thermostaphylospora chromogena TaxID=35622 RepID=A0A1H1BMS2_9ACTN|nr:DUF2530 domain-containing protein [Thermostaphylospora chromogena]SDQ53010.1 Protein of unknown function [Thermostaphylospora chromogena]